MYDLKGYEGMGYQINESGVVINKNGHPLRYAMSNSGYLRIALEPRGPHEKRKNMSIHRLVATQFIPNPDNLPVVMHKDNDRLNNHVSNLQWGTQSDNIQQAFDEGRKFSPGIGHGSYKTPKVYEVYNPDIGDSIKNLTRTEVSELIGYKEISLKNMVGNGRRIALGEYKDYMIRSKERDEPYKEVIYPIRFIGNTSND